MTDPSPSQTTPPVHGDVVPENQAKQGGKGLPVVAVLVVALVLVVVAFAGLYLFHAHPATDTTPGAATTRTVEATKGT